MPKKKNHLQISDSAYRKATTAILSRARLKLGLSKSEAARRAGMTYLRFRRLEQGERKMVLCAFIRIARALEYAPNVLLRQIVQLSEGNGA